MDGLPTELIQLCRLASMAECGDQFWDNVPSMGVWAAVKRRWRGRRPLPPGVFMERRRHNLLVPS